MKKLLISIFLIGIFMLTCGCANAESGGGGGGNGSLEEADKNEIMCYDNSKNELKSVLGVTYWGGKYIQLNSHEDSLTAAVREISALGSKVIKVACGNVEKQYPLDDFSGYVFERSVDVLKADKFKKVFDSDFETFYICVSERKGVNWRDGMLDAEKKYVSDEFYEMTKYLLNTYKNSGKTFVLQNWETDNYIGQTDDFIVMRNYATYFNARQDGINNARKEFIMSEFNDVYVFGAIEINRLKPYSGLRAVDEVVPFTYCDLYTYSSYEAKDFGVVGSETEVKNLLLTYMRYYKSKLPDESKYPQTMYFKDSRLAITEFGYPDRADGYKGERSKMVAKGHLMAAKALGLQHLIYWQITCNEAIGVNADKINKLDFKQLREYEFKPYDLNGFYLIRPDNVKTYTYNYFKKAMQENNIDVDGDKPQAWV